LGDDAGLEPGQALASAAELYARAWRAAAQPFAGSKRPEVRLAYSEVVADLAGVLTDLDARVRPGRTADPALVADAAAAATAHNAKAATPQPYDPDGADRRPPLRP